MTEDFGVPITEDQRRIHENLVQLGWSLVGRIAWNEEVVTLDIFGLSDPDVPDGTRTIRGVGRNIWEAMRSIIDEMVEVRVQGARQIAAGFSAEGALAAPEASTPYRLTVVPAKPQAGEAGDQWEIVLAGAEAQPFLDALGTGQTVMIRRGDARLIDVDARGHRRRDAVE